MNEFMHSEMKEGIISLTFNICGTVVAVVLTISSLLVILYNLITGVSIYQIIPAFVILIGSIAIIVAEIYTFKNYKENEYIIKNGLKIGGQVVEVKPLDKSNKVLELKCFGLIDGHEYNFTGVVNNRNNKSLLGKTVIIYVNPRDYNRYVLQTFL